MCLFTENQSGHGKESKILPAEEKKIRKWNPDAGLEYKDKSGNLHRARTAREENGFPGGGGAAKINVRKSI
jgi:hypothetical protein